MTKVLLINPSYSPVYGGAKAAIMNPILPTLGLATIAATALQRGHSVEILDMSWRPYDYEEIRARIWSSKPDIVGITATTPLMNQVRDMSVLIKDISKNILVVAGGAHPAALPAETLRESLLDAVFVDEADYSFAELCDGDRLPEIEGIYYREGETIARTPRRRPIEDLDELPMPAWELYDPEEYRQRISRVLAKRPPLTTVEFSRGCVFKCDFCASKMTMALGYRKKSPKRCAEEVKYINDLGFHEFFLTDDIFTSDQKWATAVSEEIAASGVDVAWTCQNGIRVESADEKLFAAMRKAGCYRVSFGFESGNDRVLKQFGKGGRACLDQGRQAVSKARAAGIDTFGFFLVGLSPDTEESMLDTINFARRLPLDMLKFSITIAFPGTPMFGEYRKKELIRSFNWDQYFTYTNEDLFAHEFLTYDTIRKYLKLAYRRAIFLNPGFVLRRLRRGIISGEFFWDFYYALKTLFTPLVGKTVQSAYHARDRWPQWDFASAPPQTHSYQMVGKTETERGDSLAAPSA